MQANRQGGFYKSLTVSRNGNANSNTILGSAFLKKTENYTCVVRDFVTNITPPLNDSSEVAFQIFIRGTGAQGPGDVAFPVYWQLRDTQFTPSPYHSTIEFLRQAQQFFHKFTFLVRTIGAAGLQGTDENGVLRANLTQAERTDGYPFIKNNWFGNTNRGWAWLTDGWSMQEVNKLVQCRMMSDGVFELMMSPAFANNFYIQVGVETRRLLGFDEHVFAVALANGNITFAEDLLVGAPATFNPLVANNIARPVQQKSKNALHQLDERMSLDVIATLPISNKIISVDGDEEHEYILARFPLNDYNRFDTKLEGTDDRITDNIMVVEEVNVGLEDMTQNSPSSSAIYLLPGTIQEINFQLRTRYYSDNTVKTERTNMNNGFWTITLLFGKKV